jgi:signal transduction histidine kinase
MTTMPPEGAPRMTTRASLSAARPTGLGILSRPAFVRWPWAWRWESAVTVVAVVSAAAAFWVTINAKFLAHPYWLAVQKADFIVGPVFVGLYWRHRRPNNRLGLLLIILGLFGVVYIGSSVKAPLPFGIGVYAEIPVVFLTEAAILAFPSGRLDGLAERGILAFWALTFVVGRTAIWLTSPHSAPWFSISACRSSCPANYGAIWSPPRWAPQLVYGARAAVIVAALATAGLLVRKFFSGTPPRRRALAIGAPIALLYLLLQATYQGLQLFTPADASAAAEPVKGVIDWAFAGARSAVWYGFLLALIAAELFAGRTLRRLVGDSLGRPSFRELEGMVRGPLGDPGLRLGQWRGDSHDWADPDGEVLAPQRPDQRLTEFERCGRPAVAVVHDEQLSEDPELLQAVGAVALLALEIAELDSAWKESLGELADSRARLVSAGTRERRKLERDLHDGAQQRLVAASIDLSLAAELADANPDLHDRVSAATAEVEGALAELREVAHGIYPAALARWGLARALELVAGRYQGKVMVIEADPGRFAPELEAAVYYCCLEAVQNASKHAGRDAHVSIRLYTDADQVRLEVHDNGPGFDTAEAHDGIGLQNMRDRLGAVLGHVEISSQPGHGTLVAATAPLSQRRNFSPPTSSPDHRSTFPRTTRSVPAG